MKKRFLLLTLALSLSLALPARAAERREAPTLAAGLYGTTYVSEEGDLWAWGDGYRATPMRITEGLGVSKTAIPGYPAMLVRQDGTFLFFAGGFFEDGGETICDDAREVANDYHGNCCYLLDEEGILWGWGTNYCGTLSPGNVPLDEETSRLTPLLSKVTQFSALANTVLAVKEDGTLWSWGSDRFGQLGTGTAGDLLYEEDSWPYRSKPAQVMEDVAQAAMGNYVAFVVKTDGTLWGWGSPIEGLFGEDQCDKRDQFGQPYASRPVQIMTGVRRVATGAYDTVYIIKEDNSLWVCGGSFRGEAGTGSTETVKTPTKIMEDVKQVAAGEWFAVAEKLDGTLWAWGDNNYGQLGIGQEENEEDVNGLYQPTPTQIVFPSYYKSRGTAYATTQNVLVDGRPVTFETYALKDAEGNDTNYIKVRDLAYVLNGTAAQFEVGWDGKVSLTAGQSYTPNGSEMSTPYSGDRAYRASNQTTVVNGEERGVTSLILQDDAGNGYTYYQLRQLGDLLGFTVDWSPEKGIFIETE